MLVNRPLLSLFFALVLSHLGAQDIHYTQFSYVPVAVNPAQAGLFEGTYRVGGLYRSQWQLATSIKGYQTPIIYADMPFSGLRKQDWIGIGINLFRDRAGLAAITNTNVGLAGSYHMGLDKKQNTVLSFGVQAGLTQRNIDKGKLIFQDGLQTGQSKDAPQIEDQNKSYSDINVGVNLRTRMTKTSIANIGLSVEHFLTPKYNLNKATIAKLPRRINLYGNMDIAITKKISFYPGLMIRAIGGSTEIMGQGVAGLKIDEKKGITVKGGLGYRIGDAAQILGGIEYGDIRAGIAYDFTLSGLRTSSIQNGFELAVGYIGKLFKSGKPSKVILCPQY
jgi:type IX secretion system PorP/SprF family membrane protein